MLLKNAPALSHEYIKNTATCGGIFVDATCGNGYDTLLLSTLAGEGGRVYGFDIQPEAIEKTKQRLSDESPHKNTTLICDGHENMEKYIDGEIDLCMFNFGYLPGADHKKATKKDTSLKAIGVALKLLRKRGIITLCVYSGGDTGFEEKDAILEFCRTLDQKKYNVLLHEFINQKNNPPILICIEKR